MSRFLKRDAGLTLKAERAHGGINRNSTNKARGANSPLLGIAAAAALMAALPASSATVDKATLAQLTADAKKNGAAAVLVNLQMVGLDRISADPKGVSTDMAAREKALLDELGPNAWAAGRWENGLGQAGFFATEAGLRVLANSSNAISFTKDEASDRRLGLDHPDGRLGEMKRLLYRDGTVEVVVTPNVEGLEFDTSSSGAVSFRMNAAQAQEATDKGLRILNGLSAQQVTGKAAAVAALTARSLSVAPPQGSVVRVTREGLVALAQNPLVRSVQVNGFTDARPAYFEEAITKEAAKAGTAEVVVTLRNNAAGWNLSPASRAAEKRSVQRDLEDVLRLAGVKSSVHYMPEFGVFTGRLTAEELGRLNSGGDSRVVSVVLNKPLGTVELATSTQTMNVRKYWTNPGYPVRGNGQWVVVMDTGVDKTHPFFLGSDGTTRVKFEACFGTNQVVGPTNYRSMCPSQDANGDSPQGLADSGMPVPACSTADLVACVHGTHVAGIAAGSTYTTSVPANNPPTGVQGVAPDAYIAAVNVFSFDQAKAAKPTFFQSDILAALQAVVSGMSKGNPSNPFTVNMSLGGKSPTGNLATAPCDAWTDYAGMVPALRSLYALGVPVIAATGNDGAIGAMRAPACLPSVIKVSSVLNDTVGTTRSGFANVAAPSQFPGETMWFAPGGGDGTQGTSVTSAIPYTGYTTKFAALTGTSQATPHVAGLYALAKGYLPPNQPQWTVDGVTSWLKANAAVPVTVNPCLTWVGPPNCPYQPYTINALRLP